MGRTGYRITRRPQGTRRPNYLLRFLINRLLKPTGDTRQWMMVSQLGKARLGLVKFQSKVLP